MKSPPRGEVLEELLWQRIEQLELYGAMAWAACGKAADPAPIVPIEHPPIPW